MSTIIVGDMHGCLDELDELLAILGRRAQHRLVFLGDLVDRGPDSAGVVRRVRELGAACVMGNHDEKHVRWARNEARHRADPRYVNQMRPLSPDRLATQAALGEDGLAFLAALPLTLDLGDGWWAMHGGAAPKQAFAKQKAAVLLRCRWVDAAGAMIGRAGPRPPGARHWAEAWPGPERIIYGHHVHGLDAPRRDGDCIGIDTGCCFGGKLTAYVLPDHEIIQVPARRAYAELRDAAEDDA